MQYRSHILLLGLLLLISPTAWAGSVEKGVYTSDHGYSVGLPDGWDFVDKINHDLMVEQLPEVLREADGYDVLFFDPKLEIKPEEAADSIHDNFMVVVIPFVPELTEATIASISRDVRAQMEAVFAQVELVSVGMTKHDEKDAIDLEWRVNTGDAAKGSIIIQTILPGTTESIVATCSFGEERAEGRRDLCLSFFKSIDHKE